MTGGLQDTIENPRRARYPVMEAKPPSETPAEGDARRLRNADKRAAWTRWVSARCRKCGYVRVNVIHELDPATAPEGPEYFADFLDQLHPFQGKG